MTVKQRKQQLRGRAVVGSAIALVLCGMIIGGIQQREDGKASEMIEATEDVNRFDMEAVTVEPNPEFENIRLYDVPLDESLQLFTLVECNGYEFWPNIVFAMMDVECDFDINAVSPKGAVGPMQVVEKYHKDRMELLGCDNLSNPYQNIKVGMHYLAELWSEKQDICWVLMAYRHGRTDASLMYNSGIVDEYALEVLARAAELQREMEEQYEDMESLAE